MMRDMLLGGARLRELTSTLAFSRRPVAIAKLVCDVIAGRIGQRCTVSYVTTVGQPLVTIDNIVERTDPERLQYLAIGWRRDRLLAAMLGSHRVVQDCRTVLVPLLCPSGVVGAVQHTNDAEISRAVERELVSICMLVVGRLTQLGFVANPEVPVLTRRQYQIAELATLGLTTAEIGESLAISRNTVKRRLQEVFDRLRVNRRIELVRALQGSSCELDADPGVTHDGMLTIAR